MAFTEYDIRAEKIEAGKEKRTQRIIDKINRLADDIRDVIIDDPQVRDFNKGELDQVVRELRMIAAELQHIE